VRANGVGEEGSGIVYTGSKASFWGDNGNVLELVAMVTQYCEGITPLG
jgi:hypothetical protein